jgi:hypothetical protein
MEKRLLLFVLCVLFTLFSAAQSGIQLNFVSSTTDIVEILNSTDSDGNLVPQITKQSSLSFELSDTVNIGTIRIKLGSSESGAEILNEVFDIGGQILSSGHSMQRVGLSCKFDLGQFSSNNVVYLSIECRSSTNAVLASHAAILN